MLNVSLTATNNLQLITALFVPHPSIMLDSHAPLVCLGLDIVFGTMNLNNFKIYKYILQLYLSY